MPTEHISSSHSDQLNSYNVAQLQFTLAKSDDIHYLNLPAHDAALDYTARRMSSSATSNADTENSSVLSRPEKRSLTPDDDQHAKKLRSDDHPSWEHDKLNADPGLDQSKVQLPSISTTLDDNYRYSNANDNARRSSLPVLHSESRVRHAPYPSPSMRHNNYAPSNGSSLSTYTFPPDEHPQDRINARPKVSTDVGFAVSNSYDSSYPSSGLSSDTTTPSTAFSSSSLASDLRTPGISPYSESDNWNPSPSGIVRPSSTPGQLSSPAVKYDDGLRHASFSAPMSQAQMFAGSARISGQHDRRSLSGIKGDWPFPNSEFALPSNGSQYSPSLTAPNLSVASPSRSPSAMPASTLVDRPPRKRGKLPKETTDYLKAWLHRHSDHPYPSEEEKKHLCHATGLSMSQVSNWMINARRRILAPAHRAASGPTTTAPFPPSARSTSLSGLLDPIATNRRSSMPSADALQLYHPMTLQSMPNSTHHSSEYGSRHGMLNMPSSRSNHLGGSGLDYHQSRHVGLYAPGQGTHGSHNQSSQYTDVPLSAPPSLSNNPFSSHNSHSSGQNMYPSLLPSPRSSAQQPYYAEGHSHSGSGSGSTYGTPQ